MKRIKMENSEFEVSQLALGMMRNSLLEAKEMQRLLEKAKELGIDFVDHADIYAWKNSAEEVFGQVMSQAPHLRNQFVVQTKCGICQGYYDSSYNHIVKSAEMSLKKMGIDVIDILLLHRPDALMEPEEIAKAFDKLESDGKVKYFGVSNMNSFQIEKISRCISQKLLVDQVHFNVAHASLIDSGIYVNMRDDGAIMRDGGLLDYAQIKGITIQAWSILQISREEGSFLRNIEYKNLNEKLEKIANKYNVTPATVSLNWILRHPAKIQAITGTTNPMHLEELVRAFDFQMTRQEWYELYLSTGKRLP